ncbi:MAG: family 2 glycosyl transferase [Candidatus Magasanikbacteria bacterium GW2011_GWD2_43_18]|uniref:Family 2 glycosyl transferase n=1 Tax=Candidatus Magasanikbacteria bacterium GW2011_GWE2_42_7 TaxID=1619052 RepID=A0A0G1BD84_9BACT|nr:MAG: family 2 glycosyl transferase [Candidatus Magasanikbacteria bacterium GW2011_GWC2_42_27]KKS71257.1 MAG: family 2 glycosyl transferase [Candidatus Magasanikbacteria bacterium GW2011_GWE2_42_7]KKT04080.1 MAG: family 2 glycosyl transferase [Candidatus Magasanikbacteria bacterium GW2011_GWD2_43_18]KKT24629.1 MAG: family 2 glycosyl transferase [Candidatus Magasanikbacteria bacterium GW2011_GWA2_43_9]HCC13895.1 hypothetical protein [Candidatus Magasanikbacteria bacterium]
MNKLTVSLALYSKGEAKYLPYLFDSLKKQTFQDWELLIVDNAADGDVISVAEGFAKEMGRSYRILHSDTNEGFAKAHNKAYRVSDAAYFLMLNPDMYLEPTVFADMVSFLDEQKDVASVAPRLMRWDFAQVDASAKKQQERDVAAKAGYTRDIDAIGVRLFRNRRAVEWLAQYTWEEASASTDVQRLYEKTYVEVFGVSGALAMFRKKMIDTLLLPEDAIFDPTYGSYKEDLDLAYRMRNAGFTSYVLLKSVAYHDRTGAAPKKHTDVAAIKNKRRQSPYIRFHSYKNHLRTLYKNEYWQNVLRDLPFIFWYEAKKFGFILFTDPRTIFLGWFEILKHVGYTRRARKAIVKSRKMYWKGLRRWF